MPDFSDHKEVLKLLSKSQEADKDNRDAARESHLFIDKRDGQWEPYWWHANDGKPRYTFDMTTPIVEQIAGDLDQSDFDIKIKPSGGEASKDTAQLLDGLIRNIENISGASHIFSHAGRNMVTGGFDCWQVVQKFVDDDSFDQDLVIDPVANAIDSVWFDVGSKRQDRSDSRWCFVLEAMAVDDYKEKFPEGSEESISAGDSNNAYECNDEQIVIGQFYHIDEQPRELLLLSTGEIVEEDEAFLSIVDELQQAGISIEGRRTRNKRVVKSRLLDNGGWLGDEQETVFNYIPVIPTYGNFKIFENKILYRGVVEKLLDAQRVMNYSKSREIEEGALAPRAKYCMTEKQAEGHEDELATLNTNSDPVQFYNPDAEAPPPQQNGGAAINPGLNAISNDMRTIIQQTAGMFAASMGDNPNLQSGVAIDRLISKGHTGNTQYFTSQEVAICHTARILVDAIPKVYDTQRQVRILREDGSFDMSTLQQSVIDEQTGQLVTINDLSKGKYDVTCTSGPSFKNRQQETVAAFTEVAALDPTVMQTGSDILFNNITAPGMDLIAQRKRDQLFQNGLIPEEQMTDEEKQKVAEAQAQAASNPPEQDPLFLAAQAEMQKAQADLEANQIEFQKAQVDAQLKAGQQALAQQKQELELFEKQAKFSQQQQQAEFDNALKAQKQRADLITQALKDNKTEAETLKIIREAMGVDSIVGPNNTEAYIEQAENVNQAVGGDEGFRGDSLTRS